MQFIPWVGLKIQLADDGTMEVATVNYRADTRPGKEPGFVVECVPALDYSTTEEKRAILEMLAIKVTATADRVDIAGVIPLEATQPAGASPCLLTTVQTWA